MDRRRRKSIDETLELSERMSGMRAEGAQVNHGLVAPGDSRSTLKKLSDETNSRVDELDQKIEAIFQAVQALSKTVEGMQQLLVKAGEYKGKPRGRLPR